MNMQPFLNTSLAIQVHAATAVLAFFLGTYLLIARKGDRRHKFFGKVWITLMVVCAMTALAISEIKTWGYFSPIHLFVPFTLWGAYSAIRDVRAGKITAHKKGIMGIYSGALLTAGLFTFLPGRVMSRTFFADTPWLGFSAMAVMGVALSIWLIYINFGPWRSRATT